MKKWAYYNDIDECACHVTKELMSAGLIAPGVVDCRSIKEVTADDVREFAQAHWFCGMSGWSIAARLAGWPDDRPLWSASCPCQPHSAAASDRKRGFADDRDLWPVLLRLVAECRPHTLAGEQVDDSAAWIERAATDMEGSGYAFGALDLPALAVDADHERMRTYFVAYANGAGREEQRRAVAMAAELIPAERSGRGARVPRDCSTGELGRIRRIERGIFPVAHGHPGRREAIHLAGNGIVLPLAAEVLAALKDTLDMMEDRA